MENPVLEATLEYYDANFKKSFDQVFTEYRSSDSDNKMWLAGPSSYVFSLSGVKFAVDLIVRRECDLESVRDKLSEYLSDISFILITHQHDDHFCIPLLQLIKDLPIRFYIPEGMSRELVEKSGLKDENITYVKAGDVITEGSLRILVFNTPHLTKEEIEEGESFTEVGYLVSSPRGNVLMPSDVRDYAYSEYPKFENIDLCISHVWGGRDAINRELYMPKLAELAEFSSGFRAKRYFLCHLYEIGRGDPYMWHDAHADIVTERMLSLLPDSIIEVPRIGQGYRLFEEIL